MLKSEIGKRWARLCVPLPVRVRGGHGQRLWLPSAEAETTQSINGVRVFMMVRRRVVGAQVVHAVDDIEVSKNLPRLRGFPPFRRRPADGQEYPRPPVAPASSSSPARTYEQHVMAQNDPLVWNGIAKPKSRRPATYTSFQRASRLSTRREMVWGSVPPPSGSGSGVASRGWRAPFSPSMDLPPPLPESTSAVPRWPEKPFAAMAADLRLATVAARLGASIAVVL